MLAPVLSLGQDDASQQDVDLEGLVIHETVELDLQQVYVTVTDSDGRRVLDLPKSAFRVEDEGRIQELITFESGEIPLTTALLLDASQSMSMDEMTLALTGLSSFVASMNELDEARALVFSDELLAASEWFGPDDRGEDLLPHLDVDGGAWRVGGSALFDQVQVALSALERRQGRRVLILLSDGWDLHSVLTGEQIRRAGRRSRSMVYWVRLDPDPPQNLRQRRRLTETATTVRFDDRASEVPIGSWRDRDATVDRYFDLEELVTETGGRVVDAAHAGEVDAVLQEILQELRDQYALGYYPDPERPAGTRRKVSLRVDGDDLAVRARSEYVVRP